MDKQTAGEPLKTRESMPDMAESPLRQAIRYVEGQGPKADGETKESLEVLKSF